MLSSLSLSWSSFGIGDVLCVCCMAHAHIVNTSIYNNQKQHNQSFVAIGRFTLFWTQKKIKEKREAIHIVYVLLTHSVRTAQKTDKLYIGIVRRNRLRQQRSDTRIKYERNKKPKHTQFLPQQQQETIAICIIIIHNNIVDDWLVYSSRTIRMRKLP